MSGREERALDEIEQQLASEDPRFAASMRRTPTKGAYRRHQRGYDAIIVIAALSAALCWGLSATGAGLTAAVLALLTFYLRPRRSRPSTKRRRQRRSGWR